MRSRDKQDHLSSSFTDLMSSLVVIFILLFLAFVHEQEGRQETVKDKLLAELQRVLKDAMSAGAKIDHRAPRERRFVAV